MFCDLSTAEEKRRLKPMMTYFIRAGENHNWETNALPAKIVDVVVKSS